MKQKATIIARQDGRTKTGMIVQTEQGFFVVELKVFTKDAARADRYCKEIAGIEEFAKIEEKKCPECGWTSQVSHWFRLCPDCMAQRGQHIELKPT